MASLIWTLISIMVVLWVVGLLMHVTVWAIHLLLVGAVILFVFNLVTGRKAAV